VKIDGKNHNCIIFLLFIIVATKLDLNVGVIVLEEDGTEIDDDEVLAEFASMGKTFMVLSPSEVWAPQVLEPGPSPCRSSSVTPASFDSMPDDPKSAVTPPSASGENAEKSKSSGN
jgi:hypothetical protein